MLGTPCIGTCWCGASSPPPRALGPTGSPMHQELGPAGVGHPPLPGHRDHPRVLGPTGRSPLHWALGPVGVGHPGHRVGTGSHWCWALAPTGAGSHEHWAPGPLTLGTGTHWCWAPPWASATGTHGHWGPTGVGRLGTGSPGHWALGPTGVGALGLLGIGHQGLWVLRIGTRSHGAPGTRDASALGPVARTPGPTSSEHPGHRDQRPWASHTRTHRRWALGPMGDGHWDPLVARAPSTGTHQDLLDLDTPCMDAGHPRAAGPAGVGTLAIKHRDTSASLGCHHGHRGGWEPAAVGAGTPGVPQDVLDAAALAEEGVDDGGALGHQRGLAEEGDDGEDAVEALELGVGLGAEGDALAQLRQDGQVQDDGAGQQRVLWAPRVRGEDEPPPGDGATPRDAPVTPPPRSPPHTPRTCCG